MDPGFRRECGFILIREENPMPVTVLYPEARQQPDNLETEVFGPDLKIVKRDTGALAELSDADCAEADGLMIMGLALPAPISRASPGCARSSAWGSAMTSSTAPPPRRATSSSATSPITARPRWPTTRLPSP